LPLYTAVACEAPAYGWGFFLWAVIAQSVIDHGSARTVIGLAMP
jgi:hypothetical protein